MIPKRVEASKTLSLLKKIKDLKAQGVDIASFTAGEPDFQTPDPIIQKSYESMKAGETKYVDSQGIAPLRKAIAQDYVNRQKAPWVTEDHVLVTAGSKQGIFLVLEAVLDPGDEVLVPVPYWVSYPDMVGLAWGKNVFIYSQAKNGFFPTVEELDKAWTPKTKALVFSSPSNPTGCMIKKEQLEDIIKWCVQKKVLFIYDELYERIVFDGKVHHSAATLIKESESDYVIVVNALSKTMAMTGWRLGWVVSSKNNIKNLTAIQSQMLTCVPAFIQQAGIVGVQKAPEIFPDIVASFQRRKDLIMKGLSEIPGLKVTPPEGAFYVFVDVKDAMKKKDVNSDTIFSERLLEEAKVSVVPGSSFGMDGWIRLSFATSDEEIKKGIERIKKFLS